MCFGTIVFSINNPGNRTHVNLNKKTTCWLSAWSPWQFCLTQVSSKHHCRRLVHSTLQTSGGIHTCPGKCIALKTEKYLGKPSSCHTFTARKYWTILPGPVPIYRGQGAGEAPLERAETPTAAASWSPAGKKTKNTNKTLSLRRLCVAFSQHLSGCQKLGLFFCIRM